MIPQFQIKAIELKGLGKIKRVIHEAVVLHRGWEMDNYVYLVEMEGGKKKIITTSHGEWVEMSKKELIKKADETRNSLDDIESILDLS